EYIRRKMNNFFDLSIVDEVHELKAGNSAQGNALSSLAAVSKKIVAGTGTLFGGKAEDIYYLLWRLFPNEMVKAGFSYSEVRKFNEEYGNIEQTTYERNETSEQSNKASRGGTKRTEKVMPGISPFIYGKFMVQNSLNVRLKDVWPDPVELVDTPTIMVEMNQELEQAYRDMIQTFERQIQSREDGWKLYLPMTDYGVSYPDNPLQFPSATYINEDGNRETVWDSIHLPKDITYPKEEKLQEIIKTEMSEGRKSIVYVKDTGSSVSERDVRPRLKEKLEDIGAKVCILDTTTTKTNRRSEWLENKMENEGYDVCIVSQELVKVGLDLLCTPTLIFYQFSWSLFTINQAAKRAWRIGQEQECRLYYLAYKDTHQETMATLIARKNKATAAINGEVSSDGLSAMLGDEGDLQSMLVNTIKKKGKVLKGSAEDWTNQQSDRAREILENIGKKKTPSLEQQFTNWLSRYVTEAEQQTLNTPHVIERIQSNDLKGFTVNGDVLEVEPVLAFGMPADFLTSDQILSHLAEPEQEPSQEDEPSNDSSDIEVEDLLDFVTVTQKPKQKKRRRTKKEPVDGQLQLNLF
ncbi:helicase-related protein, partial [Piscibacillus sp. B03]|uniref:helicase-related protein n=1 Tax=Piscibacillus sp. B03 TaxID=3457430 RepID=UPI003FCC88BC